MDLSGDKTGQPLDYLRQIIQSEMLSLGVSIPAIVDSFDPATQMIEATPVIRRRRRLEDGSTEVEDRPKQIKIPLCTPYVRTLGFSITMPLSPGDHVMLIFADRGIDLWQETGDISDPPDVKNVRAHNYTDALYIIGPIPLSDPIEDYQIDSIEVRNRDRSCALQLWDTSIQLRVPIGSRINLTTAGDVEEIAVINIEETAGVDIISQAVLGKIKRTSTLGHDTIAGTDIDETSVAGNINSTAVLGNINHTSAGSQTMNAGTTITMDATGKILIDSDVEVEIKAPIVNVTGNVVVDGTVTAAAFIVG